MWTCLSSEKYKRVQHKGGIKSGWKHGSEEECQLCHQLTAEGPTSDSALQFQKHWKLSVVDKWKYCTLLLIKILLLST